MPVSRKKDDLLDLASQWRSIVVPLARHLRVADSGFTATQLSVIGAIDLRGPISLGDLAVKERLSPAMISKVVRSLEDEGMVARIADAHDRRISRVVLTDAGHRWIAEGRARRNAWLRARMAALTAEERAVLAAAAPIVERFIEEEE